MYIKWQKYDYILINWTLKKYNIHGLLKIEENQFNEKYMKKASDEDLKKAWIELEEKKVKNTK